MRAWLKSFVVIGVLAIGMSPPQAQSKQESNNAASKIQGTEGQRTNRGGLEVVERVGDGESETPKSQAISVLHEIIDHADQLANYESKGMLIGSALDLLWKHDASYARSSFHQALDRFFVEYSSKTNTTAQRNQLFLGIRSLISKLVKHDPAAGAKRLSSFETLVEEVNENRQLSVKDQLSVAHSSLDLDAKQSAMLAARVLKVKATVAISGLLASLDAAESGQAILEAATEINKAEGYDGGNYSVTIELPKLKLLFPLSGSSLDTYFERSAKTDWVNTINAASTISRIDIRRMAQIAACRSVL